MPASDLIPFGKGSLTLAEFNALADIPAELESLLSIWSGCFFWIKAASPRS
jgi:hypothetical protein